MMAMRNQVMEMIRQGKLVSALWALCNILQHDIGCWKDIAKRADPGSYIKTVADLRVEALGIDVDAIFEVLIPLTDKQDTKDERDQQIDELNATLNTYITVLGEIDKETPMDARLPGSPLLLDQMRYLSKRYREKSDRLTETEKFISLMWDIVRTADHNPALAADWATDQIKQALAELTSKANG